MCSIDAEMPRRFQDVAVRVFCCNAGHKARVRRALDHWREAEAARWSAAAADAAGQPRRLKETACGSEAEGQEERAKRQRLGGA